MPADACQYIYDCRRCGHRMKPIKGKCCALLLRVGPVPSDAERVWLLLVSLLRGARLGALGEEPVQGDQVPSAPRQIPSSRCCAPQRLSNVRLPFASVVPHT